MLRVLMRQCLFHWPIVSLILKRPSKQLESASAKSIMNNSPRKKDLRRWCLYIFAGAVLIIFAGLWHRHSQQPKRVSREHADTVSKEFEYLTRRINLDSAGNEWLSTQQAQQDLDELEWLLENRYSYLRLKGVDYKAALDSIRSTLGDGINRSLFGYQLGKLIALFGDGHSRVASSTVQPGSLCLDFPMFLIEETNRRLVAFKPDRLDFVDPDYPFLRAIDGLPIDSWLKAAGQFTAKGSPQYLRYHSIRNLRYIECIRKELGLSKSGFPSGVPDTIEVQLESADGSSTKRIELPLVNERPIYGFWPRPETEIKSWKDVHVESRILQPNIGYMRFVMMLGEPEFLDGLIKAMRSFAQTDGLIIDIRTNGGGRRAPLHVLLPFFMAEHDSPRIVNVAAYRLGVKKIKADFTARYLYPVSSGRWSDAERAVISSFAGTFQPEWMPPKGQFSRWHYFVISPSNDERYYYYNKPVVILMDRYNFSACDIFLGAFKGWKNVTLMGLPSGGGSGCSRDYRLCNSQIRFRLSSMASFQPNGKLYDGNGIQPDIMIEPVPTDFIGKTDSLLDAAVQFIGRKNK